MKANDSVNYLVLIFIIWALLVVFTSCGPDTFEIPETKDIVSENTAQPQPGPKGDKGDAGPKGDKGDAGKSSYFYNGVGKPSDIMGKSGDYYIDLSSFDLYEYVNTTWVSRGTMKGGKGEPGDAGKKGDAGAAGEVKITTKYTCSTLIPNDTLYTVKYTRFEFGDGAVYAKIVIHDDERHYGSNSEWYNKTESSAEESPVTYYWDKQQNDDYATYVFSFKKTDLGLGVAYTDPVDGNASYSVNGVCTKKDF